MFGPASRLGGGGEIPALIAQGPGPGPEGEARARGGEAPGFGSGFRLQKGGPRIWGSAASFVVPAR